jgi:hypothetical protein
VLSRGKIIASAKREDIPRDGLLAFYRRALEELVVEEKEEARGS